MYVTTGIQLLDKDDRIEVRTSSVSSFFTVDFVCTNKAQTQIITIFRLTLEDCYQLAEDLAKAVRKCENNMKAKEAIKLAEKEVKERNKLQSEEMSSDLSEEVRREQDIPVSS